MNKYWDSRQNKEVESKAADDFINDLMRLYSKHGISISHEDGHGAFVLEPDSETNRNWVKNAHLEDLNKPPTRSVNYMEQTQIELTPELDKGPWTEFWDMHSGGKTKLDWEKIYIQLPQQEAISAFEKLFDRRPENITCNCCGKDYAIGQSETLTEAIEYHAKSGASDYINSSEVKLVNSAALSDIKAKIEKGEQ